MKKSIYSLVLSDDVIYEIDRMAYERGTSRSNLINQILAEHVSLATPEMRNRDIFLSLEQLMGETFQRMNPSSDSIFSLRSPLRFKYKPVIRYQLELGRDSSEAVGNLRISLRSQNRQLLDLLNQFFRIWMKLEGHYLVPVLGHPVNYRCEDGKMNRELYHPANLPAYSGEDVGNAIADYIRGIDHCIKVYFAHVQDPAAALTALMEQEYRKMIYREGYIVI